MIKKAGNLFTTAYLILIFGIYPLYMRHGYVDIGNAKYQFFIYCSGAALVILTLIGGGGCIKNICRRIKQKEAYLINWDRMSGTDVFVMLYATEIFISYAFSDYRKEALWGTEGWYIGLVLLLTLCSMYVLISRLWDGGNMVWYVGILVSGITFLLGILDRFSLYLLPLEIRQPDFISTLGNINWFCGYLSVLAPIGICRFIFQEEKRILYGIYMMIVFMAGFCQGGNSIFLFFGALFYILKWISVKKKEWTVHYFLLISLWGFSAQLVRMLRFIIPDGYNYETNNLCAYLTSTDITLWIGLAALAGYAFLRFKWKRQIKEEGLRRIHILMALLLLGGVLCWLILAGINTRTGIPGLAQTEGFLLNREWGNGRGAAIYSSFQMYGQMPVFQKIFGAGPDCFSAFAYSLPEVAEGLRDYFGASRLTNAHNEFLTALINTGILGVCFFAGIFISFIKKCMKKGRQNSEFYIWATCIVCYFAHNMVSFAQVLNLSFLFLILGMGEAKCRQN